LPEAPAASRFKREDAMSAHELEDDRRRRRDLTCLGAGLLIGGGLGALAGAVLPVGGVILMMVGAVAGGGTSQVVAVRISADEWDPPINRRPYVGANSPDE
jgi:hypothetical protein